MRGDNLLIPFESDEPAKGRFSDGAGKSDCFKGLVSITDKIYSISAHIIPWTAESWPGYKTAAIRYCRKCGCFFVYVLSAF